MPLLRNNEFTETDAWSVVSDDAVLPNNIENVLVSLTRYLDLHANGSPLPGGVIVSPADDVHALSQHIQQLKLIAVDFPIYTDGRGYTHARLIRKRLGYNGELRALGDVRIDSVLFMMRSGIDSFHFTETPNTALIEELTMRYTKNYQPSYPLPVA